MAGLVKTFLFERDRYRLSQGSHSHKGCREACCLSWCLKPQGITTSLIIAIIIIIVSTTFITIILINFMFCTGKSFPDSRAPVPNLGTKTRDTADFLCKVMRSPQHHCPPTAQVILYPCSGDRQDGPSHWVSKDQQVGAVLQHISSVSVAELTQQWLYSHVCDGASSSGLQGHTPLHRGWGRENLPGNRRLEGQAH